jgi:hypothetical protein
MLKLALNGDASSKMTVVQMPAGQIKKEVPNPSLDQANAIMWRMQPDCTVNAPLRHSKEGWTTR